ncbi:MAG: hypothetical protein HN580_08905 [Deltaproteobacteria bacterium]|nr:hypothetical protein [Deltaproteobacteria bacterium]MBT4642433.1 hypothetical protein [Deltaproteobacteria bacterium]MBT6499076.1 hypothetical protein [Deltaproteobacteria bacterium]MBT6616541.1 hypothetical protein [Deltaproteobacteria bacterium]MBT7153560.1 hypothetical protein [Deltaproteobacteria bacterium]
MEIWILDVDERNPALWIPGSLGKGNLILGVDSSRQVGKAILKNRERPGRQVEFLKAALWRLFDYIRSSSTNE